MPKDLGRQIFLIKIFKILPFEHFYTYLLNLYTFFAWVAMRIKSYFAIAIKASCI